METNNVLKTKVPFSWALLLIMVTAVCTEQIFLQAIKENKRASDAAVMVSLLSGSRNFGSWPSNLKEKVALTGANVPLLPGAKRLTFDNNYLVRYRVKASASLVADFYRQVLASQGWRTAIQAPTAKLEKLTITYAENSLSKKTDITYAYIPTKSAVLGVKIAEAESTAPAATETAPAPAPETRQPVSDQPMTPVQPPMDNQAPPQEQPINQPIVNQMEFSRPPLPPNFSEPVSGQYQGQGEPGPMNQDYRQEGSRQEGSRQEGFRQQGPSEEDQAKMDERRFKDMKKGLSQFANGAKMMKRSIAKIKIANNKCGVGMPEELENALAQTDNLVGKINAAKTADELDEIIGDIQDVGSVMQDWGPRMGDLSRLCQMLKQAARDLKQFDRGVKRLEAQAKANKKVDVSELIAEYKTAVNAQKNILAQVKELAKTDADEALTKIEDDFYGNLDNLGNLEMQISTVINISKGIKDLAREISTFGSQIKSLAKKKIDIKGMQELLNSLKTRLEEIKALIKEKADPEDLVNKIEEAFDGRQELRDALQEYDLIKTAPKVNAGSGFNVKVNLPEAFRKNENNNDEEAAD